MWDDDYGDNFEDEEGLGPSVDGWERSFQAPDVIRTYDAPFLTWRRCRCAGCSGKGSDTGHKRVAHEGVAHDVVCAIANNQQVELLRLLKGLWDKNAACKRKVLQKILCMLKLWSLSSGFQRTSICWRKFWEKDKTAVWTIGSAWKKWQIAVNCRGRCGS